MIVHSRDGLDPVESYRDSLAICGEDFLSLLLEGPFCRCFEPKAPPKTEVWSLGMVLVWLLGDAWNGGRCVGIVELKLQRPIPPSKCVTAV